jgi:uncharacterized protein
MINDLVKIHLNITSTVSTDFKRYLYDQIKWDQRLIGIIGGRRVGKMTLLLQYYKMHFTTPEDCLYISCDFVNILNKGLYSIVEEFFQLGGKVVLLDEIHKYQNWSQELKNIYDAFPNKKIVFSGSSSLDIIKGKSDLSRRAVIYHLAGLSFREFLILENQLFDKPYTLDEILKNHMLLSSKILKKTPVLKYFKKYLQHGYYPYYLEGVDSYTQKTFNALEKIMYEDIPSVFSVRQGTVYILKKLLNLIAISQPFVPNIERIASALGISREYVYVYLGFLTKAGLLNCIFSKGTGFRLIRKPEKIYLENTNLIYTLGENEKLPFEIGAIRECFFVNQLKKDNSISYSEKGDFFVNKKYLFEIGGKQKGFKQIKDTYNGYIVADDIEVGYKNKIPLYLFGLLY